MLKLSNHYTSKKQTKMESKGPRFDLGDFCIKLGSVTMNQTFKGILVEVNNQYDFIVSNISNVHMLSIVLCRWNTDLA